MIELTKRGFLGALMASVAMPVLGQGTGTGDDAALLKFLDAAFDAQVALSPEF